MKKLFSFLDDAGIKYDPAIFGGAFLYSAPVSCEGCYICFSRHEGGPDNAPELERVFLDYIRRRRSLAVIDTRAVYAPAGTSYTFYKVAPVREYEPMAAAARLEGEMVDHYCMIYHEKGQAAADAWFEQNKYTPAA